MGNALTPLAVNIGRHERTQRNAHRIVDFDRWLTTMTRGHVPLLRLAGLGELTLQVPGRKSGAIRTTPLLCASHEHGFVLVGSNWGQDAPPAWVANLRAAEPGTVFATVRGNTFAVDVRELHGDEREAGWRSACRHWPNYEVYATRTHRVLPVFHLTPRL